jgi:hypothetical protein
MRASHAIGASAPCRFVTLSQGLRWAAGACAIGLVGQLASADYCSAGSGHCHSPSADEVISEVIFVTIDQVSSATDGPAGCYTDNTGVSTSVTPGSTYPIEVHYAGVNGGSDIVSVWIDWNQDTVFDDATERVDLTNSSSLVFTGNVPVPAGALPGSTRMRVRVSYAPGYTMSACGTATYGEVEDYTVSVTASNMGACCASASNSCTFTDSAGCGGIYFGDGTSCSPNPCEGACCTPGSGACTVAIPASCAGTYQGSASSCTPNPCGGACCPVGSATCSITDSTGCSGAYQGNGTTCSPLNPCGGACCDGTSCNASLAAACTEGIFIAQAACSPTPCVYCSTTGNCNPGQGEEAIVEVLFNGIDHTSDRASPASCYSDFTQYSTALQVGQSYPITLVYLGTNPGYDHAAAWVDWNRNLVFDADERTVLTVGGVNTMFTGTITVPPTASPGQTALRLRITYSNTDSNVTPCGAAGNAGFAETEDYGVLIIPADYGACCDPSGACTHTDVAGCSGAFLGTASTCLPSNPCGGACCDGLACTVTTAAACASPSIYIDQATCAPSTCTYCVCGAGTCLSSNGDEVITHVVFNTIDNTSSASGPSGCYTDFTSIGTIVGPGQTIPITVTSGSQYPGTGDVMAAWVDWNHDYTFDSSERVVLTSDSSHLIFSGDIVVPAAAPAGTTRMRIRSTYQPANLVPCDNVSYGETEDYSVSVTEFGFGAAEIDDSSGNGNNNGHIDPGESAIALTIPISKGAGSSSTGVSVTLTSLTPTVSVVSGTSAYADLAAGGSGENLTPFVISIDPSHPCGGPVVLQLDLTADGGQTTAQTTISLPTGNPPSGASTFAETFINVNFPDNDPAGAPATYTVSGVVGQISAVRFRFTGNANQNPANLGTGLGHANVGEVRLTLTSPHTAAHPQGITVVLCNQPGSPTPSTSNNFGALTFDDTGASSIQDIGSPASAIAGVYRPLEPLSAFNGLTDADVNGDWTLVAADVLATDPGLGIAGGYGGWIRNAALVIDASATCDSPVSTSGVCCRGATCSTTVAQVDCTAPAPAGALYVNSSSTCNSGGSTTTPCCYADFNKSGDLSVGDIFDYLNAWFAASPFARIGSDGTPGPLAVADIFAYLNAWFAGC